MMAGYDQNEPNPPPWPAVASQAFQPVVKPAVSMTALDPAVQSFLDRQAERHERAPTAPVMSRGRQTACFHPVRCDRPCPVLIYLHVGEACQPEILQMLADSARVAVLSQQIEPTLGLSEAGDAILAQLDAIADPRLGLDPAHVALGGEGLGALAALSFASGARLASGTISLLIMATPVLGPTEAGDDIPWPPPEYLAWLQTIAANWLGEADWHHRLPTDWLERLPSTLLITAEADPFRDAAESLARRMMGAECDLSCVRMLGTIHDFTHLPELLDTRATQDAHALIAQALRQHLFD